MSIVLPSNSRQKLNAPSRVTLPGELIVEILSLLNVKSLMQLKCVSKSWNSIISDSSFVKMHLHKSSRIPNIMVLLSQIIDGSYFVSLHLFPVRGLLENPIDFIKKESKYQQIELRDHHLVIGSCNGFICLLNSYMSTFYLWNPATTRPFSFHLLLKHKKIDIRFSFGYDNLTNKYKLVAYSFTEVSVFTFGHNVWKNIPSFSVNPYPSPTNRGIYYSNSLNWFAILNNDIGVYHKDVNVEQLVITSLDLGTETYTEFPFPQGFEDSPDCSPPVVCKLMDSLCLYHYDKDESVVIWQMKEFGVEKSWTKLLKFDYHSLPDCFQDILNWLPLHVVENGDMLILATDVGTLIRYKKDNRVVWKSAYTNNIHLSYVIPYVESLVSTF